MPEERAKVTKMGKWVEIADSRNLDLPLWLVWPVYATFILLDQCFLGDFCPCSGQTPLPTCRPRRYLRDYLRGLSATHQRALQITPATSSRS